MKKTIQELLLKILPTRSQIVRHANQEPPSMAQNLDVDSVHSALRSAESGECTELFAIYRDIIISHAHTQGEFSKRKLAVLNEPLQLTPENPENKLEVDFIKSVENHLNSIPDWIDVLSHFLDSTLYPVSVAERIYQISDKPGWRWQYQEIKPVPHNHLIWPQEKGLSRKLTSPEGNFSGENKPIESSEFIIHRAHLLSGIPDYWGGPMRAILFWWLFAVMGRDWWARFLDRYGAPFIVGKYDNDDEQSRYELEHAFSFATKIGGLVTTAQTDIEMLQAATSGGDSFENFHGAANREISKLIVGQTLSSEAQNVGFGGGQGDLQSGVRDDLRQFDANKLAHAIKTQILKPLWTLNAFAFPLPAPTWGVDVEEAEINGALVASLAQAGLTVTEAGLDILGARVGFPLQRIGTDDPVTVALSARSPDIPLIPAAVRRSARKQQARRATAALIQSAAPPLAAILRERAQDMQDAIELSASPEEALEDLSALTALYDPTEASDLIAHMMSSASANALSAVDN